MRSKPCFSSTQVCVCPLLHQVRNSNKRGGRGAKRVKTREIVRNGSAPPSVFTHSVAIVVEDVFGHLTLISKPDILIQLHACSRRIFFFFFLKSHPPQRGSYTVAPPNKHFAHSTQMAHQNALIHTPVLSHTTCITSKQNLLSSCPYRRFHFGQFPVVVVVVFFGGGSRT